MIPIDAGEREGMAFEAIERIVRKGWIIRIGFVNEGDVDREEGSGAVSVIEAHIERRGIAIGRIVAAIAIELIMMAEPALRQAEEPMKTGEVKSSLVSFWP